MKFKKTYVWFVVLVVLMTGVLAACQSGFKVTYNAGENGTLTATADGESFVSGSKAEADKSIEFAAAPNSGYSVDVWTVNGTVQTTGLDAAGTKLTLIADKELEVSVTFKRLYNVVWELDGGHWPTGYTPVTGVAEGDKLSAPSAVNKPVKDDYTFLGWYASADGTQEFDFSEAADSDATVYAKWEVTVNKYDVVFSYGDNGYLNVLDDGEAMLFSPARIAEGSRVVFEIVPDENYIVESFLVDGVETEISADNQFVVESLSGDIDVSVAFAWHFDTQASVGIQAERLRAMLKTVGEYYPSGEPFFASEVTVNEDVGAASFTARGNTFGNMIDEYGVTGGFRVTVYSSEADAIIVWGEGMPKGKRLGHIIAEGKPHGIWTIETLIKLGPPKSIGDIAGNSINVDKEYADKALGVQAELTRHGFQTSLSGIHVMISSETRKAFCAHVYIEQNQGSAGVVGARFSARVFGDEAWAQASLGSPFLADTNENTVVGNIMITSNSPVLRDTIADYLNGVPRDPTPDLEEKDNFLNEELEKKLQEVYLWDDYHKNSTVRFLARDFAALWTAPTSMFGFPIEGVWSVLFSTEEAAVEFYESYRDFDSNTRPRTEDRVRIGRLVVFGREVAYWGYLNILQKEGFISLETQTVEYGAADGNDSSGEMFASFAVWEYTAQSGTVIDGELVFPEPLVVNRFASGASVVTGSVIELTFVPADGYEVKEVLVNGEPVAISDNTYRFAVTENVSVRVVFAKSAA